MSYRRLLIVFLIIGLAFGLVAWRCARWNLADTVAVSYEFIPGAEGFPKENLEKAWKAPVTWLKDRDVYTLAGVPVGRYTIKASLAVPLAWKKTVSPLTLITPDQEISLPIIEEKVFYTGEYKNVKVKAIAEWFKPGEIGIRAASSELPLGFLSLRVRNFGVYDKKFGYFVFRSSTPALFSPLPPFLGLLLVLASGYVFACLGRFFCARLGTKAQRKVFAILASTGPLLLAFLEFSTFLFTSYRVLLTPFGLVFLGLAPGIVAWFGVRFLRTEGHEPLSVPQDSLANILIELRATLHAITSAFVDFFKRIGPRDVVLVMVFLLVGVLLGSFATRCVRENPGPRFCVYHEFLPNGDAFPKGELPFDCQADASPISKGVVYHLDGVMPGRYQVRTSLGVPLAWNKEDPPLMLITPEKEIPLSVKALGKAAGDSYRNADCEKIVSWSDPGQVGIRLASTENTLALFSLRFQNYRTLVGGFGYLLLRNPVSLNPPPTSPRIRLSLFALCIFFMVLAGVFTVIQHKRFWFLIVAFLSCPILLIVADLITLFFTPYRLVVTPAVFFVPVFVPMVFLYPMFSSLFMKCVQFVISLWRVHERKMEERDLLTRKYFEEEASRLDTDKWFEPALCLVILLGLFFGVAVSRLAFFIHEDFTTYAFDLGVICNSIWNSSHGDLFQTTLLPWRLLGEHCCFTSLLYAPIYWFWAEPRILIFIQNLLLGLSAVPLFLLSRRVFGTTWGALCVSLGYLLHPALRGIALHEFHEISGIPFLSFTAVYFLFERYSAPDSKRQASSTKAFIISLFLMLCCREDASLLAAALGFYIIFQRRDHKLGVAILVFSALWLVITTQLVIPYFKGQPYRYIEVRYSELGGSVPSIVSTLLFHPVYSCNIIFSEARRLLMLKSLGPVLFLPLLSVWAIPLLIPLATCVLASEPYQHAMSTHYPALWLSPVFIAALIAVRNMIQKAPGSSRRRFFRAAIPVAILIVAFFVQTDPLVSSWRTILELDVEWKPKAFTQGATNLLSRFKDADASVSAQTIFVPHLANRKRIYQFPEHLDADYVIVDVGPDSNKYPYQADEFNRAVKELAQSGKCSVVDYEGTTFLLKSGAQNDSLNQELLKQIGQ